MACEVGHHQRPHSMPVGSLPSSTGGVTTGVASAYCVVLQSPAAALQVLAKVQVGVPDFLIVVLPLAEVMIAVSPGLVSWMHSKVTVQTDEAPSCRLTMVWPRCDRISSVVPRTPMVASGVMILEAAFSEVAGTNPKAPRASRTATSR